MSNAPSLSTRPFIYLLKIYVSLPEDPLFKDPSVFNKNWQAFLGKHIAYKGHYFSSAIPKNGFLLLLPILYAHVCIRESPAAVMHGLAL